MRLCFALMLASKVFRFSRSYSFTSAAARSRMSSGEGERLRVLLWGLLGSDIMLLSSFPALYFCKVQRGFDHEGTAGAPTTPRRSEM